MSASPWRASEPALAEIRSLDENAGKTSVDGDPCTERREWLVRSAERSLREMEYTLARRNIFEPAARRAWLPIPSNSSLNPMELEKPI